MKDAIASCRHATTIWISPVSQSFGRNLLHLQPSDYTTGMSERQLVCLLYRDHVGLKHADRGRLGKEVEQAKRKEADVEKSFYMVEDIGTGAGDPMRKALLDHMLEAHKQNR